MLLLNNNDYTILIDNNDNSLKGGRFSSGQSAGLSKVSFGFKSPIQQNFVSKFLQLLTDSIVQLYWPYTVSRELKRQRRGRSNRPGTR